MQNVERRLKALVAETIDVSESNLELDTDLLQCGRLDSLALVSIVSGLRDEFGVNVPVDALVPENFRSIRRILDYIESARV